MKTAIIERSILRYTNRARKRHGFPPLAGERTLIKASRAHSRWMADRGRFTHTGTRGSRPHQRMKHHGFGGDTMGENIYMLRSNGAGFRSDWNMGRDAVTSWMNSPGHRRNILNRDYNRIGIGVARKGGSVYMTQNFGHLDSPVVAVGKFLIAGAFFFFPVILGAAYCAFG